MSIATNPTPAEWLNARAAARVLNVPSPRTVRKLADKGLIAVRDLPGVQARYSRQSCEALARTYPRPSSAETPP
jgi:hypothetical protein